jgi:Na+/proline symporter
MNYLIGCALVGIVVVALLELGRKQTPERFLVAERKLGGVFGALAVAASWIWAPALFVSTHVGYKWGYSGLFWFVLPNILALTIFAPVAYRLRHKLPEGFSYIEFIKDRGGKFRELQLFVQLIVQVLCCALQITAGAELLTFVSGTPYTNTVAIMAIAPLGYCLISGLVSSIWTDFVKYLVIISVIALVYLNLPILHNLPALISQPINPFDPAVMWQFGLGSAFTLIFGIFSNHQQWQRAFASNYWQVRQTYQLAGLLHGIVTFSLGTLGVALASSGYVPKNMQIVGAEYIATHMAPFFLAIFTAMAVFGLCATMSSALCAFASLYATEIAKDQDPVKVSRLAMIVLSGLSFLIAAPRFAIIPLWMFCGLIRLGTATPTIASIYSQKLSGKVATLAIVVSIAVGAPLFIYGSMSDNHVYEAGAMMLCLAISAVICLVQIATASSSVVKHPGAVIEESRVPECSAK